MKHNELIGKTVIGMVGNGSVTFQGIIENIEKQSMELKVNLKNVKGISCNFMGDATTYDLEINDEGDEDENE